MPLTDLSAAPAAPEPLTGSKLTDLERELAACVKLESGSSAQAWESLIVREKARYAALAEVLAPNGPLANAFSKSLAARQQGPFAQAIPEAMRGDIARQEMVSILNNRRNDALSAVMKLDDAAWLGEVKRGIDAGTITPYNGTEQLSADKLAEERKQLLGTRTTPEPAVHIIFSAIGHMLGHQYLAEAFAPKGEGSRVFLAEMQKRLPAENPDALKAFDERWMALRSHRAGLIAEIMKPDAPFVQETIAEAERLRYAPPAAMFAMPTNTVLEPRRASLLGRLSDTIRGMFGPRQDQTEVSGSASGR